MDLSYFLVSFCSKPRWIDRCYCRWSWRCLVSYLRIIWNNSRIYSNIWDPRSCRSFNSRRVDWCWIGEFFHFCILKLLVTRRLDKLSCCFFCSLYDLTALNRLLMSQWLYYMLNLFSIYVGFPGTFKPSSIGPLEFIRRCYSLTRWRFLYFWSSIYSILIYHFQDCLFPCQYNIIYHFKLSH